MSVAPIGGCTLFVMHSICGLGLTTGYWISRSVYSFDLITNPAKTLSLLVVVETPIIIGIYSWLRGDRDHCSLLKAVGRGFLGLPIGALINAFVAIVLGAPVGIKYWEATIYWSLLMSLFTFVPAACVFGSSRVDWQQILTYSKSASVVDYMISIPAHGAILGAWLGALPMPLDWERPWQEWPVCVTYGSIAGYLIGTIASSVFIFSLTFLHQREFHVKAD